MERTTPPAGPRMLLKRLRDTMARAESIEDPLGEVVRLVANEMVAEVCSIYLLRAGEVLELFATQGLNPSAVHRTRLRVGEGLVGDIAAHHRPLSLADAQSHPQYAYRPETGEEIYHSLAGVPIVRAGRVLGVLVVQNRTRRHYDEEEIETLQTIAMVLAELVAAGHIVSPNEMQQVDGLGLLPLRVDGVQLTPGVAIGHAVLHEPRIVDPEGGRRGYRPGAEALRGSRTRRARGCRPHARGARHAVGRAARDPGNLPHVRRRSRLARAHARSDRLGPHRRGGRAARLRRRARAAWPIDRSLHPRAAERPAGSHQPAAAAALPAAPPSIRRHCPTT